MADITNPLAYLNDIRFATAAAGQTGSAEDVTTLGTQVVDVVVPPDSNHLSGLQIWRHSQLLQKLTQFNLGGTRQQVIPQAQNPFGATEAGFYIGTDGLPRASFNGIVTSMSGGASGGGGGLTNPLSTTLQFSTNSTGIDTTGSQGTLLVGATARIVQLGNTGNSNNGVNVVPPLILNPAGANNIYLKVLNAPLYIDAGTPGTSASLNSPLFNIRASVNSGSGLVQTAFVQQHVIDTFANGNLTSHLEWSADGVIAAKLSRFGNLTVAGPVTSSAGLMVTGSTSINGTTIDKNGNVYVLGSIGSPAGGANTYWDSGGMHIAGFVIPQVDGVWECGDASVRWSNVNTVRSTVNQYIGAGSAPSASLGTAAGVGATWTISGSDSGHLLSITTAGSPAGASAPLATVTFSSAGPSVPYVQLEAANSASAGLTVVQQPFPDANKTFPLNGTGYVITGGSNALITGITYKFFVRTQF